jgi:hypothetical protein
VTATSTNPHAKLDPDLVRKAELLKHSEFFVGTTDGAPLVEKQQIFLVLATVKPLSSVMTGHWVPTTEDGRVIGRHTVGDDPKEVKAFLDSLGLASKVAFEGYATTAVVTNRPGLLSEYQHATDSVAVGRLFGFPETAIAAFAGATCMDTEEQHRIEKEAGIPDFVPTFRFSRDHWCEELSTVKEWSELLHAYGLGRE